MNPAAKTPDLTMEQAISRAIQIMKVNLSDPLTMDDIARAAMYSKFHFSREFQRVTGVSPGRFLAALRLEAAKALLVTTPLSVIEISHRVGYTSVGTFSYRFAQAVGLAPSAYRKAGGRRAAVRARDRGDERPEDRGGRGPARGAETVTLRGQISAPPEQRHRPVAVALFPTPYPQGLPVRCALLRRPGPFVLDDVPPGRWHLMGCSVPVGYGGPLATVGVLPAIADPVAIDACPGVPVLPADLALRAQNELDPPILPALPDIASAAFQDDARRAAG